MMENDLAHNYLQDLLFLLREKAVDARAARDQARGTNDESFATGKLLAYYEVVSLAKSQAVSFQFEEAQGWLASIDPDQDLL